MTDAIHIFVHNITSRGSAQFLISAIPGALRYDQRALLIAQPEDIVCLHGEAADDEYLSYLYSLGIGPQRDHIVVAVNNEDTLSEVLIKDRPSLDRIRALVPPHCAVVLDPYVALSREFALATVLEQLLCRKIPVIGGNPGIVTRANHKDVVLKEANLRGVPVAPGEIVEFTGISPDVVRLKEAVFRQIGATGKVIVRGVTDFPIPPLVINNTTPDVTGALQQLAEQQTLHTYLVQSMFNITVSPNVQFTISPDDGSPSFVGISDQILDAQLSHKGNISPSLANTLPDMIASARKISEWLQSENYTGIFGIDFVEYICPQTAQPAHFLAELNARVNGATYPHILMNRLGLKGAFLSLSVASSARSFIEFRSRCSLFLFDPATGRGVVPYNTGCLSYGICWLAIYGETRQVVQELYRSVAAAC